MPKSRPFLYEKLSAAEFLRFVAGLYGIDGKDLGVRIDELLELVELPHVKEVLIGSFSHGFLSACLGRGRVRLPYRPRRRM